MMLADHTPSHRLAFTLIETLLALALSSALMLAVFSLVDSTVTYHVTGSDQVLVSQRTIGLLHDLRLDVRAVQADPHWQAIPDLPSDFDERIDERFGVASQRLNSELQLSDMEKFAEPIRLAGQSNWLMLTLGQANPRWPGDAHSYQQIVWSMGGQVAINVPTHDSHGRWITQLIPGCGQSALLRTRIPTASVNQQRAESELVIAADDLRFRYLADGHWQSSWNSSTEKRLPDAVEVNLQISGDAAQRRWVIQTSALNLPARARR